MAADVQTSYLSEEHMTLIPFSVAWLAMACAVLGLALYRKIVARNEHECILMHEQKAAQQSALAERINFVDRWGQTLTIVTVVFGVALGGVFLYQKWVESFSIRY